MKVSDCCGARPHSNGDSTTEDYGICSDCKEHCTYVCEECGSEDCDGEPCKYVKQEVPPDIIVSPRDKIVGHAMKAIADEFERRQNNPFQYVVGYYRTDNDKLIGYHADTFCSLVDDILKAKRYAGEDPYAQLAVIRKNLDYTLDITEEKAEKVFLGKINLQVKNKFFSTFAKEDIYINAEYFDKEVPPQRLDFKTF